MSATNKIAPPGKRSKFRQGCGFPWARKRGHGCLLVIPQWYGRLTFEDMICVWPCPTHHKSTSHWKIVGNESQAKGSMNICQWGPVGKVWHSLLLSCTVVFCMPMIWYSCVCLILEHFFGNFGWSYVVLFRIILFNSWDDPFLPQDYIYGTPPPLTVSRSEEWLKGNKRPMQTGDSTMRRYQKRFSEQLGASSPVSLA